jgi:Do/DeqQ family serine protease
MYRLLIAVSLFFVLIAANAHAPVGKEEASLAPMLAKVTPSVVNIKIEKITPPKPPAPFQENPVPPQQQSQSSNQQQRGPAKEFGVGSGVIFNAEKGYIVTNAHVVHDANIILVTLKNGRRYRAKLIGESVGFDIAIIQIHAKHLQSIHFGDSDKLRVGDFVAAIGSPFGLTQTVTSGVISALNRDQPRIEGFQSFIQTDAPINPGNSGGALVNMHGKLVGINTAIYTGSSDGNIGIGFSIPSNMVKSVIEQLLKYGHVKQGMLGVIAQNLTPELANALGLKTSNGVIVTQVIPQSAADKAGLKASDVIEGVNDKIIKSSAQLRNTLGLMPPGTPIKLKILRDHKPITVEAKVGDPNKMVAQREIPYLSGLRLQNFEELEADGTYLKGVVVNQVNDLSQGALAGLVAGDVILQANGKAVTTVKALEDIARNAKENLVLVVNRDNKHIFLVVRPTPEAFR